MICIIEVVNVEVCKQYEPPHSLSLDGSKVVSMGDGDGNSDDNDNEESPSSR